MVMGVKGQVRGLVFRGSVPVFEPLALATFFKKCIGFGLHPADEASHRFVLLQGFDGGVLAGQFGLGEQGVNLAVAYAVQHRCL